MRIICYEKSVNCCNLKNETKQNKTQKLMGESVSVQDRGKEWQKQVGSWRRVQTEQPL